MASNAVGKDDIGQVEIEDVPEAEVPDGD